MKQFVETIQKQTMGVIFNVQNYYMVLTERRNLLGTRAKSASDKSSSSRFSLPAARNANTKATEYVALVFLSVFWFSSPYRKVLTSLSVRDTEFLVF